MSYRIIVFVFLGDVLQDYLFRNVISESRSLERGGHVLQDYCFRDLGEGRGWGFVFLADGGQKYKTLGIFGLVLRRKKYINALNNIKKKVYRMYN